LPNGKDLTVTIEKVVRQMVTSVGGREEECTVAKIKDNKPLILNVTNSRMIQNLYNTPYIEDWSSKEITLYSAITKMKGEEVECLRIRPKIKVKPELKQGTEEFKNVVKAIQSGYKMKDIKTKYTVSQDIEKAIEEA